MQIAKGTTVAVSDGEKLHLFRNAGDDVHVKLVALPAAEVSTQNTGSGSRHHSSSANHDAGQLTEDNFAAGTAEVLNRHVLDGTIASLVVIAAPRALGELRKHYHAQLSAVLVGEIAKDLTGHPADDIESAIAAA